MSVFRKRKAARRKTQSRPTSFLHFLGQEMAQRSKREGLRVRISAEEAISYGVHREYLFHSNGSLRVNAVHVFSSEKGSLACVPTKHVSLDMDTVEGPRWGLWHDIEPEDVANLIRQSFELDPAAYDRDDDRFDDYAREAEYDRYAHLDPEDEDDGEYVAWSVAA